MKKEFDDFVHLLDNPLRDWPHYYVSEVVLCKRASAVISHLLEQNERLEKKNVQLEQKLAKLTKRPRIVVLKGMSEYSWDKKI